MQVPHRTRPLLGRNLTGDLGPFTIYTSRRAGTVWFLKSPPQKPPNLNQIHQRNRFRMAARAWKALTQETRDAWNLACRRSGLYVHGYNLWIFWQLRRLRPHLATIEHQSGIQLLPE